MNWAVQDRIKEESREAYKGVTPFHKPSESSPQRRRFKRFYWLAWPICIFAVLYGTSYLALFSLPPYEGAEMISQLTADYGAWAFVVFQPVDPAILEEIKQEQGLPEQMVVNASSWSPQAGLPTAAPTPTEKGIQTSSSQATSDGLPSSPIVSQPPSSSTSVTISKTPLPESTVTPQPTQVTNPTGLPNPQKTPKRHKSPNPQKTPRPPKTPKK